MSGVVHLSRAVSVAALRGCVDAAISTAIGVVWGVATVHHSIPFHALACASCGAPVLTPRASLCANDPMARVDMPHAQTKALKKQLDEEHARHAEQGWPTWAPAAAGLALVTVVGFVVASRLGLLPEELTL